jgi:ATP-dependent Lon protease
MISETPMTENVDTSRLDRLLTTHFAGKVVRKDLTKLIKEGANVPVYVLEYLLGMYCASDDEATIQNGMTMVKRILAENYVRPDEAEKIKSKVRESGSYKVIDKVSVKLNEKRDVYEALLSNLGVKNADFRCVCPPVREAAGGRHLVHRHAELPVRGKPARLPFTVTDLKPIQMPNMDMEGLFEGRRAFTEGRMDRCADPLDGHGAGLLQGAGEVASARPHDPAGREQL